MYNILEEHKQEKETFMISNYDKGVPPAVSVSFDITSKMVEKIGNRVLDLEEKLDSITDINNINFPAMGNTRLPPTFGSDAEEVVITRTNTPNIPLLPYPMSLQRVSSDGKLEGSFLVVPRGHLRRKFNFKARIIYG